MQLKGIKCDIRSISIGSVVLELILTKTDISEALHVE